MQATNVNVHLAALQELSVAAPTMSALDLLKAHAWAVAHGAFREDEAIPADAAMAAPVAMSACSVEPAEAAVEAESHSPAVPAPRGPAANLKVQPWSAQDDLQLLHLTRVDGKTVRQAAEILGRSLRACEQRLSKLRRENVSAKGTEPPMPAATSSGSALLADPVEAPAPAEPAQEVAAPAPPAPAREAPPPAAPTAASAQGIPALNGVVHEPPRERPRLKVKDAMAYYLARSRDVFTPRNDYTLMTRLMRGDRVTQIADDCGLPAKVILDRSRELIPVSLRDRNGNLSIEGAPIALEALRRVVHGEQP